MQEQLEREQICEIGRRCYARGLVAASEGNISVRLDAQRVLCTPSGVCKGLLKADDLCIVGMDARPLTTHRRPSSEILVHLAVYAADEAVRAVVHSHPPFATTFALLGESVPRGYLPEAEMFLGEVPVVPYATTGTSELAALVGAQVPGRAAVLLQNHGAVTWGTQLEQAYARTETLEAVCRVLFQARQIGQPRPIPADKLAALRQAAERYSHGA